jgi:uncharacterized tellurite resistance protein B-like protein
MFERVFGLLKGTASMPPEPGEALRVAVAAVLVEAAQMDDRFDEAERRSIESLLARRFALTPEAARRLLEEAARAADASVQLHGFLRRIRDAFGPAERIELVEMLWEVAYADGALDPHEDALIRRIAGLVAVDDRDRGEARRRVRRRLGIA